MKLFALVLLLLLLGASGSATHEVFAKAAATPTPHGEAGMIDFGCWILLVVHVIAACVMVGYFFDSEKSR